MTPTRKGLYNDCQCCLFNTKSKDKYPCILSHKDIRRHSGSKLEREFKDCGIHKEKEPAAEEEEILSIINHNQLKLF